jgi:pyruvate,orthophosphate dikinase
MNKRIFHFGNGVADGCSKDIKLLGGKGANLAQMCKIGLPVPNGFTITTNECIKFYSNNSQLSEELKNDIMSAMLKLESDTGKKFGDIENPLLVSVRSGAAKSMPGMMDTILNLGINMQVVESLIKKTGNEFFALDSYRRFIQMYGNVVMNIPHYNFEDILSNIKLDAGVVVDSDLRPIDLRRIINLYLGVVKRETNLEFPTDANTQLLGAIEAVLQSWMNDRAKFYRKVNGINGSMGTAVNVQAMVFGNMGKNSATGVVFTRNPSTGENKIYGEYLVNAQGEDVVDGSRTPRPILSCGNGESMQEVMPDITKELIKILQDLELHYKDMQDVEFTIEEGKIYILQTRNGKRSIEAAVQIAHNMFTTELITKQEAVLRIDPNLIDNLLHPYPDPKAIKHVIAKGLAASPGVASGKIAFCALSAENMANAGDKVILVRKETNPDDINGMYVAVGILTAKGGMTSHAAVVARGMGRSCIVGCDALEIDDVKNEMTIYGRKFKSGDVITIDGSSGEIMTGEIKMVMPVMSQEFLDIVSWAGEFANVKVRANAETVRDCKMAIEFGAVGIGLCRTEHMFFEKEKIASFRQMIICEDVAKRNTAIEQIKNLQKQDFISLFKILNGLPINIRLLDPPLHEFLPTTIEEITELEKSLGVSADKIRLKVASLHETNPMLGHRGIRLGVTFPEIYAMQAAAIFEAYAECVQNGIAAQIEIMLPLVIDVKEITYLKSIILQEKAKVEKEFSVAIFCKIGTMIEAPRACVVAGDIAKEAEYFSFGTNDLTQTTLAISRDDAGKFIKDYLKEGIIANDPFVKIDENGVGMLMKMAVDNGRNSNANLVCSVCGEHGGDPASVAFFCSLGVNYVSCSPYRIFAAKIAAAHFALNNPSL